jgi:cation transport ATPase
VNARSHIGAGAVVKNDPTDVASGIRLTRVSCGKITQNLFWRATPSACLYF